MGPLRALIIALIVGGLIALALGSMDEPKVDPWNTLPPAPKCEVCRAG